MPLKAGDKVYRRDENGMREAMFVAEIVVHGHVDGWLISIDGHREEVPLDEWETSPRAAMRLYLVQLRTSHRVACEQRQNIQQQIDKIEYEIAVLSQDITDYDISAVAGTV